MTIPAAITAAVSNANAMMGQGQGRMGGDHGGRGFGGRGFDGRHGGPLMIIIPLLLIAGAAFGIGMFLRRRRGSSSMSPAVAGVAPSTTGPTVSGDDMAGAILRERFARGDINEVEFLHRKAVLEGRANIPTNTPAAPMTTGVTTPTPTTTSTPAPVASDDPTVVDGEPNDQTS